MHDRRRGVTITLALLLAATASAQTGAPPPRQPVNAAAGGAGFTRPGSVETEGNTYVGPIVSKWGRAVTPANAWRSYPRPQMTRADWMNLNGQWDYAITKPAAERPAQMDGKILVPFAVESRLSGVSRKLLPGNHLWYSRSFTLPAKWPGKRTLLHFGAVDYESIMWVNGHAVGAHTGGSDPFSFDITPYLKAGANELVVQVTDPTSTGGQPRGKQTLEPRGIWYTAVSGIWQTVWLEPVPDLYIKEVRATPDIDKGQLAVEVSLSSSSAPTDAVRVTAKTKAGRTLASAVMRGNRRTMLAIPDAHLWSPDDPYLYDLTAELVSVPAPSGSGDRDRLPLMSGQEAAAYASASIEGAARDKVDTYFAMRKISVGPNANGQPVLLLNNKPLFHNGTLDQGWWPESLLTPPSEEAARYDITWLKKAGFNMLRKHIKVEPAQYYADADRLGILIWQDIPSGALGDQAVWRRSDREATFSSEAMAAYQSELSRIIGALRPFPSIVMWVTNNEGWGQYGARIAGTLAKTMDPSRLVNNASGWLDIPGSGSDVYDIHTYEEVPLTPKSPDGRPIVIGEYGGVGIPVPGHLWFTDRDARIYQFASDKNDYRIRYKRKFDEVVRQAKEVGLSAAVYTETSDVEGELNGLLTYDRAAEKLPAAEFAKMAAPLFDNKK